MKKRYMLFLLILIPFTGSAQDDLLNLLNEGDKPETVYTIATFKSTRIVNGHSIERMVPGQLDFRISHRFGRVNGGAYELFGLDQANIHFSLEYGILKWLMVGAGRGSYEKTFDGFAKVSLLRQSSGAVNMPVSVSFFSSAALKTVKYPPDPFRKNEFASRLSYTSQLLVARKINQGLSVQITPTYVHHNIMSTDYMPHDLFAVGAGGRMKLSKRISLNADYYFVANPEKYMLQNVYNPLSLGIDIETGGHVFQLIMTNSVAMIEKGFVGETTGSWMKGDIHFGFNISRVFNLRK
jgi:hypothetical protein